MGEIVAGLVTGVAYLVFRALSYSGLLFIVPCGVVWTAYIVVRGLQDPSVLKPWGLRVDNLRRASAPCLGVFTVAALGIFGYRLVLGWKPLPPRRSSSSALTRFGRVCNSSSCRRSLPVSFTDLI